MRIVNRPPLTPASRNIAVATSLIAGAGIIAIGAGVFPEVLGTAKAPAWVVLAAGAIFFVAGISTAVQERAPKWLSGLLLCVLVSLFAAIPSWVAWGEGPRQFSGSGIGLAWMLGFDTVSFGQLAFAFGALIMLTAAAFAWGNWVSKLSWSQRATMLPAVAAACYALFVLVPAEPRWDDVADDHARLARYALLAEREGWHAIRGREAASWYFPPWRNFEQWTKAARSRLAAARVAPPNEQMLVVPFAPRAPVIDGRIGETEWRGALRIPLAPQALGTTLFALCDGDFLYLAADVPADTSASGFDQFRFWFHLGLSPWLDNERAFVDRSGGVASLRTVRIQQEHGRPRARQDWRIYARAHGASAADGHRRFELALDLREAGIAPGAPMPAWFEVEGDPLRNAAGNFKSRSDMGKAGSHAAPLWLRLTPAPEAPAGSPSAFVANLRKQAGAWLNFD